MCCFVCYSATAHAEVDAGDGLTPSKQIPLNTLAVHEKDILRDRWLRTDVDKATLRIGSPVTSIDLSMDYELLLDVTADSPWRQIQRQQPVKNTAP
jgi:hypothetical protein